MSFSGINCSYRQASRIFLLLGAGILGCCLHALSIVERSPFVPSGFNPPSGATQDSAKQTNPEGLLFKGMYKLNDSMYFLVSERNQKGKWIELGKGEEDISVEQFDMEDNRLLVDVSGKEVWLELSETASLTGKAVTTPQRPTTRPTTRPTSTRTISRPTTASRTTSSSRSSTTSIRPTSRGSSSSVMRSLQRRRPSTGFSSRSSGRTAPAPVPTTGLPPSGGSFQVPDAPPSMVPGPPPTSGTPDSPFN